jgi:hypothetical protein
MRKVAEELVTSGTAHVAEAIAGDLRGSPRIAGAVDARGRRFGGGWQKSAAAVLDRPPYQIGVDGR